MATATFRIGGEFITRQARTFVIESDWERAIQFLTDGLGGFTYDHAVSVLKGEQKLVGDLDLDLDLEPEDPAAVAEYLNQIQWLWAGSVKDRFGWWRPYAKVTSWGEDDFYGIKHARFSRVSGSVAGVGAASQQSRLNDKLNRSHFYADDPSRDRTELLVCQDERGFRDETVILFKEVSPPPFWLHKNNSFQAALDEYLRHYTLEQRGNSEYSAARRRVDEVRESFAKFQTGPPKTEAPGATPESPPAADSVLEELVRMAAENSGLPIEGLRSTLAAATGTQDETSKPQDSKTLLEEHAWVTPDGKFWPCRFHEHAALSARIWKHVFGRELTDQDNPERMAEAAGWVKISTSQIDGKPMIYAERHATPHQQDVIEAWRALHGHKDPEAREDAE